MQAESAEPNSESMNRKVELNMTAEECIEMITEVLSRNITISDGPHFHINGRSTNIIYTGGKETIERLLEISSIINEYNKGN